MKILYLIVILLIKLNYTAFCFPTIVDGILGSVAHAPSEATKIVANGKKTVGDGIKGGIDIASGIANIPVEVATAIQTGADVIGTGVDMGITALSTAAEIPIVAVTVAQTSENMVNEGVAVGIEAGKSVINSAADALETGEKTISSGVNIATSLGVNALSVVPH